MFNKIKKLLKWIPIIWKDDSESIFSVYLHIHYKLEDLENQLKNDPYKSEEKVKRIKICKELFKRLSEDDWIRFHRKMFECEHAELFKPVIIDGQEMYEWDPPLNDGANTKQKIEKTIEKWHYDEAFRILRKFGPSWW